MTSFILIDAEAIAFLVCALFVAASLFTMQTLHHYPQVYGWWSIAFIIGGFRYLIAYLVNVVGLPLTIFLLDLVLLCQSVCMLLGIFCLLQRHIKPYQVIILALVLLSWSTIASLISYNWLWHDVPILSLYAGTFISAGILFIRNPPDETKRSLKLVSGGIFISLGIYYLLFIFISFDSSQRWVIFFEKTLLVGLGIVFIFSILNKLQHELQRSATRDVASGAYTRQYFLQRVNAELKRAQRYHRPFSLVLFQLNDFSGAIGHEQKKANAILKAINNELVGSLRDCDFTGRTDEYEFAIALPETDDAESRHVAERQLYLVKQGTLIRQFDGMDLTIYITVTRNEASDSAESIYERAKLTLLQKQSNDKVAFITSSGVSSS